MIHLFKTKTATILYIPKLKWVKTFGIKLIFKPFKFKARLDFPSAWQFEALRWHS